jgi:hypothetical protein
LSFKERVELWAKNIIRHLGDHVNHHMYRCWQYHVILDPEHHLFYESVRGYLFFTDFHNLCDSLGRYGEILYYEIMSKTWDLLRNGEEMWTREREVKDSAPYRDAYRLELNSIKKSEEYIYGVCTPRIPELQALNIMAKDYRISSVNKYNRGKLTTMEASYRRPDRGYVMPVLNDFEWEFNPKTDLVLSPFATKPGEQASPDWYYIVIGANKEDGDKVPSTHAREDKDRSPGPSAPSIKTPSTPLSSDKKPLDLDELGPDQDLFKQEVMDSLFDKIMQNEALRASFMLKANKSNLNLGSLTATNTVDEAGDKGEGVSKRLFSSPSKSKALSSKTGDVETAISSTLIPLLSKTKKEIKLKELASHPIQVWGDAAEDYEKQYNQHWDRNEIDRATCRIINFR